MDGFLIMRWIKLIGLWIWLIVYWNGGKKVIRDIAESFHSKKSRLDPILMLLITVFSFALIGMIMLGSLGIFQILFIQNLFMVLIGMLLAISSILGMFACRRYLGKYWTAEINLAESHQIIDTGPYRIVRHPIYTFAILMYIGLGLVFLTFWTAILVGGIMTAYILKTNDEDAYLQQNLTGYRAYVLHTRYRLVPGLW